MNKVGEPNTGDAGIIGPSSDLVLPLAQLFMTLSGYSSRGITSLPIMNSKAGYSPLHSREKLAYSENIVYFTRGGLQQKIKAWH